MKNKILALIVVLASFSLGNHALAEYEPRPGHWGFELVLKNEEGKTHAARLSTASYPETCVNGMDIYAKKIEESNGYVWLDSSLQVISYKKTELANIKHEVIEFRCKYFPF